MRIPSSLSRASLAIILAFATAACVYKLDVQQGNYLDTEAVDQVRPGMEKEQVRFLLGNPVARDTFRDDRWTYTYYRRNSRSGQETLYHVTVFFDDQELVARVEDDLPADGQITPDVEMPDPDAPTGETEPVDIDPRPEEMKPIEPPPGPMP